MCLLKCEFFHLTVDHQLRWKAKIKLLALKACLFTNGIYSRPSVAQTLMARLPRLFGTRSWIPWENPKAADLG